MKSEVSNLCSGCFLSKNEAFKKGWRRIYFYIGEGKKKKHIHVHWSPLSPLFRRSTVYSPCTSDDIKPCAVCVATSLPIATARKIECDWLVVNFFSKRGGALEEALHNNDNNKRLGCQASFVRVPQPGLSWNVSLFLNYSYSKILFYKLLVTL